MFLIGISGLYYEWAFRVIFYSFIFLLALDLYNNVKLKSLFRNTVSRFLNLGLEWFDYIVLSLLGIFIIFYILPYSLLPEIGEDALRCHLYIPKLYIQNHKIFNVDNFSSYSNMPFNIQMIYTLGLLVEGEIVAKLINFALGLTIIAAIFSFCKRYFNARMGVIASLIFYITPSVYNNSITANTDIGEVLFLFLSVYILFIWNEFKKNNLLILSAIFYGIALGSKYNSLYALVPLLFFIGMGTGLNIKRIGKNIFLFIAVVVIFISIWWIKAYIYTGNPVFPYLNKIFNSNLWQRDRNDWLNLHSYGKPISLKNTLFLPFDIVFNSHIYGGGPRDILYFLFVPIGIYSFILNKEKSIIIGYLLILITAYSIFWAMTFQYLRWLMPVLPSASIICAYGVYNLSEICLLKYKNIVKTLLILLLAGSMFFTSIKDLDAEYSVSHLKNLFTRVQIMIEKA